MFSEHHSDKLTKADSSEVTPSGNIELRLRKTTFKLHQELTLQLTLLNKIYL